MKDLLPLEKELDILRSTEISMAYDQKEDFAEWKKSAKEKLFELVGLDKFEKCDFCFSEEYRTEHNDFIEIRFSFQSEEDYFLPCILTVPKKSRFSKPPLMLCLQGHGTGMHISLGRAKYEIDEAKIKNGDRDFAVGCLKRGYCALAIEQRNFGEKGGNPRPTCHAPSLVALLTGRTIIGARVWDIMRAIDVSIENYSSYFDTEKIYSMGNSGGGTATLYAFALEDRIKAAIASCSFCDFISSIGEQNHCECNYIPNIRNYFDMAEIAGIGAPKPLVIVSGKTDGIFPLEGAAKEFERLKNIYYGSTDRCVHVIGNEGHRFYENEAFSAFEKLVTEV